MLPYELGKLFHLQMLGLQGNPLGKEMLSIYNDSNGTAKLLSYMLDNLQGINSNANSITLLLEYVNLYNIRNAVLFKKIKDYAL